jgi:biopolymer transport protein ExbD
MLRIEALRRRASISLTPLIDVVFLLLIFFMVSTTFSKESQLRVRLPEASTEQTLEAEEKSLQIEISERGQFAVRGPGDDRAKVLVNNRQETLERAMTDSAAGDRELIVVIRADRQTAHEHVVRAMDAARRLGYVRITFSTQQAEAGE